MRMIEVRGVRKSIQNGSRTVDILKGIELSIPSGQFVAIVGASGSGKSTLLGLLAGLDTPSQGEIFLDGTPIHNLEEAALSAVRGQKLGFVFQSYQLIQQVGLAERADHYPVQLSGGEQQRVALARAFIVDPPIVMADEPTGNLDSINGQKVLELLLSRNRDAGTTLVLVTHDPQVAALAHRIIVIKDGMVVEDVMREPAAVAVQVTR
jgi:putative ABC transport system ATP-binding protein